MCRMATWLLTGVAMNHLDHHLWSQNLLCGWFEIRTTKSILYPIHIDPIYILLFFYPLKRWKAARCEKEQGVLGLLVSLCIWHWPSSRFPICRCINRGCAQLCVDDRSHYCFLRDYHSILCLHILPTKPRVNTNLVDLQKASDQFTGHTSIAWNLCRITSHHYSQIDNVHLPLLDKISWVDFWAYKRYFGMKLSHFIIHSSQFSFFFL